MELSWVLLIYTVPAKPSRIRAAVWRDLKKVGAVYIRDGVGVVPQRVETIVAIQTIAAKVKALGGRATVVQAAHFDAETAEPIMAKASTDRAAEYADALRETERFLQHLREERKHRQFRLAELDGLDADFRKLQQWTVQIRARDYFGVAAATEVDTAIGSCAEELASFVEEAYRREESPA